MKDIIITLYYANWCEYSRNFRIIWNELKLKVNELNESSELNEKGIRNIILEEFEHDEIKEKKVDGFPTIVITFDNKNIEYNGKRSIDNILNQVYNLANL